MMTPNAGGDLAPDQVMGRDALIERYWTLVGLRGLVLLGPRRTGKTSVCRRMAAFPPDGVVTRFRNLEGRSQSVVDFVQALFEDTSALLKKTNVLAARAARWFEKLGGAIETQWVNLNPAEQDWRQLLKVILEDLDEWAAKNQVRVVLFWDEFTLFLYDLARDAAGARDAMLLLDVLRAQRAERKHLRMVFTGSIGLEEVLQKLAGHGYHNDPFNNVAKEVLPPLEDDEALALATALAGDMGPAIAQLGEGHPFIIQHLAEQAAMGVDPTTALDRLVDNPIDPLELQHFVDRMERYLGQEPRILAERLLDAVAVEPQTIDQLCDALGRDRTQVVDLVKRLRRDLYLRRDHGKLAFQYDFLRRWWVQERGL